MTDFLPSHMRSIRMAGKGLENVRMDTVPVPAVGPKDILCRVDATGVCTSNLKLIAQGGDHSLLAGWDVARHPVILGEEGSLTVVAVGSEVSRDISLGQRFAVQPAADVPPILHRERYRDGARGMRKTVVGYSLDGMLADYFLVPPEVLAAQCLVPLPSDELAHFEVTLAEPFACVHKSQEKHVHLVKQSPTSARQPRLGPLTGGTTVVIGAGTMGRLQVEMAMRFAPRNLLVCAKVGATTELVQRTLAVKAERLGINLEIVEPRDWTRALRRIAPDGADDIIVAVGSQETQQEALSQLAFSGVLNLFGGLRRGDHHLTLDSLEVHYREVQLVGSSGGDAWDMRATLDLLASRQISGENYVFGVGGLQHAVPLLRRMSSEKMNGRIILYPQVEMPEFIETTRWTREDEAALFAGVS
jgi:threonine dehydrogenase-like Zn-dependent dehydrogenase